MLQIFRLFALSAVILSGASLSRADTFSDDLLPDAARPAGRALNQLNVAEGGGRWVATKGVIISENGATATAPSGAHLTIPVIAGKIRIEADVSGKSSGFTGLALGRGNLSGDFWKGLGAMVTVMGNRFNIFVANQELIANPDKSSMKEGTNHFEFVIDTVARTASVRINGKTAVENAVLPKEARLDKLTAAGFRFNEPLTGHPTVSHFKVELASTAVAGLEPVDLGMCFVRLNEEVMLAWKAARAIL